MVPRAAPPSGRGGGRARPAVSAPPAGAAGPRPRGRRSCWRCLEEPEPERRKICSSTKASFRHNMKKKIEEQASNLCEYINDQLTDIEFLHKQKHYNINGEDTECSPGKLLKLLHNKLHKKEAIIEDLERKLQEYQEKGKAKMVVFEDDDHEKKMLEKENEDFKEEVFKLHNEVSRLENALKRSEKEKYLLDKQVQRTRSKMEADEQTVQKMNLSSTTKFPTLKIVLPTYLYRSIERMQPQSVDLSSSTGTLFCMPLT
ncbi:uncharacterized protein C10orf67 homolog, mitochondrial [Theristicus caerulescens]